MTYMFIDTRTDKETVVYTHTGILLSLKKEGNPAAGRSLEDIVLK